MRERLDEHSRFLESQLAGLECMIQDKGATLAVATLAVATPAVATPIVVAQASDPATVAAPALVVQVPAAVTTQALTQSKSAAVQIGLKVAEGVAAIVTATSTSTPPRLLKVGTMPATQSPVSAPAVTPVVAKSATPAVAQLSVPVPTAPSDPPQATMEQIAAKLPIETAQPQIFDTTY